MKKIKRTVRSFFDLYLFPLIVCFILIFIPVVIVAFVRWGYISHAAIELTIKITKGIGIAAVVIVMCFWIQSFVKLPVPKFLHFVYKGIVTPLYGLLFGVVYYCVGNIGAYLFERWPKLFDKVSYYVSAILCFCSGAIVYRKGDFSRVTNGIPKIVIFYHGGSLDYGLARIAMGYKQPCKILIGENLKKYPVFDKYIRRIGISIKREKTSANNSSVIKQMRNAIDTGQNIGYFPTDGRNRINQPKKKFETGGFAFALKYNIPITPIIFYGVGEFCPPGPPSENKTGEPPKSRIKHIISTVGKALSLYARGKGSHMLLSPRPIQMKILPDISLFHQDGTKKGVQELTDEAEQVVYSNFENRR